MKSSAPKALKNVPLHEIGCKGTKLCWFVLGQKLKRLGQINPTPSKYSLLVSLATIFERRHASMFLEKAREIRLVE